MTGHKYPAFVLLDDRGRSSVREIVDESHLAERKKFVARLQALVDYGPRATPNMMPLQGGQGLWKLKASDHLRIWFFCDGRDIILAHAIRETKREEDPSWLRKALAMMWAYWAERNNQ
ncbi:MAG: hypothetical protein WCP21_04145 [Armatimonadota bacterium]